jgi:hypothetical protein
VLEGFEAIVFRTAGDQPSLWESMLPAEVLRAPPELARVDVLLDDPAFFAFFARARAGRQRGDPYAGPGPAPGGSPAGAGDRCPAA